jgi:hypothetical protein
MRRRTMLAGAAIAAALAVGGCSSSSDHGAGARAAASSLAADPTYQAQVQKLQDELLANFKKDFKARHPITSMEDAVRDTFPGGSSQDIINHAVKTFSLKDAHKGPAQTAWMHDVVTFALAQGTQGAGTAQPSIPGVTSSAGSS